MMYFTTKTGKDGDIRIALRQKGYISPIKDKPTLDEIGYLHLIPETEKYMSVLNVEIDEVFQNQGWGKRLYLRGLAVALKKNYIGILSNKDERTPSADQLWRSLVTENINGMDVLNDPLQFDGREWK